jgi:hypothetical protein
MCEPEVPSFPRAIRHPDIRRRLERIPPIREPMVGECHLSLGVTLSHQPKGILVETHPKVESMLLDSVGYPAP